MKARFNAKDSLAGMLLLSHPGMKDPNFGRAVVLITSHDADGAIGVVINQPLSRRLGELGSDFAIGALAKVPLYRGGPVDTGKLLLAGWRWRPEEEEFEIQFGLEPARAELLALDPKATVRGFFGYSGWTKGQLENEMEHKTWFVAEPSGYNLTSEDGPALWRMVLGSLDPQLRVLVDEPDDPTRN